MSLQTWQETLANQQAAGTLLNTYTTAKSVLNPSSLVTIPANWFYIGRMLRMTVHAGVSNRVTGPDTFTTQLQLGPTANIAAFSSGAINLTTTANTTLPVKMVCEVTCRSVGSGTSATLMGQWWFQGVPVAMAASLANGAANTGWAMGPATAPAVGTGFDSTVANILDFWVAQSFSGAGNGIQVQQYIVEALN